MHAVIFPKRISGRGKGSDKGSDMTASIGDAVARAQERIRVKVCGITRMSDALALDALPVDYLGFNFSPRSKRFIEPAAASRIIARLRHCEPVGVFVDATPEHIAIVAAASGIRWVQLHGREGWDVLDRIELPCIKAISQQRLEDYGGLKDAWENQEHRPRFFLVDTHSESGFGGSGNAFDWSLLNSHPLPLPYFLAGGLGPENLDEALRSVRPYAVDLNSKVESAPGSKNLDRIRACLNLLSIGSTE